MKKCKACEKTKSLGEFSNKHNSETKRYICKLCQRDYTKKHYEKHKDKYKKQCYTRNKLKRQHNREVIRETKNRPCMDCGNSFNHWVMEYDHRDRATKYNCVGTMASHTFKTDRILEEIAKCDLVCANCHRTREYNRSLKRALNSIG